MKVRVEVEIPDRKSCWFHPIRPCNFLIIDKYRCILLHKDLDPYENGHIAMKCEECLALSKKEV